jgi:L-amino acid N-acyltransferase YncA
VTIRPFIEADWPAVWTIFQEVVAREDTFVFASDTPESEARRIWASHHVFVAEEAGEILGSSYIKPNQPGLGDHVANAGFMIATESRGKGVGRRLGEHAIEAARKMGFRAMQFNFVVSTNESAIRLWQSLGFETVGRVPNAFRHATLGPVDALIMYQAL